MKLNVVLPCFPVNASGGFKIIYEYMNYLAGNGHSINLYYCKDYCVPIHRIPRIVEKKWRRFIQENSKIGWFNLSPDIRRTAIECINNNTISDGDIILATGVNTASPISSLSDSKGKKVYFIQGFENWGITNEEVYSTYRLPFHKIVVSNWLKEIVDEHTDVPAVLLSNGIDLRIFRVLRGIDRRRKHTLCFHYRKEPTKGCKYAIEAVKLLKEKYTDLKVYVVSNDNTKLNLPSCCELMHGLTPYQVAEVNNKCEVFLCSSIDEGFGLPGLEAMACGCALVSSRYDGVLEYAVDGKNALLVRPMDSTGLAQSVSNLFENESLRRRIVKNALEDIKEKDIGKTCVRFETILSSYLE